MVPWTPQFKFQFCVQWVLTEFCAVTMCMASVNLIGISRRSVSTTECSNPSPSAAAENQDLKEMQSHSSAHPDGAAGAPQSSWAQHWSPSTVDRAVWGFTPHSPGAARHGCWSRLRAQELCVISQPVGGNIRSHNAA